MKTDALLIKYPYRCKACGWLYWLSYHDIMRLTDDPHLPCGDSWMDLGYAFDKDGETAPEEKEASR